MEEAIVAIHRPSKLKVTQTRHLKYTVSASRGNETSGKNVDDNEHNEWANALRTAITSEVPNLAIANIVILENDSAIDPFQLGYKLECVPLKTQSFISRLFQIPEPAEDDAASITHESFSFQQWRTDNALLLDKVAAMTKFLAQQQSQNMLYQFKVPLKIQVSCDESSREHRRVSTFDIQIADEAFIEKFALNNDSNTASHDWRGLPLAVSDFHLLDLEPGQRLHVTIDAVFGFGSQHAKWSHVIHAGVAGHFKLSMNEALLEDHISRHVGGFSAIGLSSTCPVGIFDMEDAVNSGTITTNKNDTCIGCMRCLDYANISYENPMHASNQAMAVSPLHDKVHFLFATKGCSSPAWLLSVALSIVASREIHNHRNQIQEANTTDRIFSLVK